MLNKKRTKSQIIKKRKSFLSNLYEIINDKSYNNIISWNNEGNGIIIKNVIQLCKIILPKYYSSFVRQLNIYGFHKSQGIIKDGEGFVHDIFGKKSQKNKLGKYYLKIRKKD